MRVPTNKLKDAAAASSPSRADGCDPRVEQIKQLGMWMERFFDDLSNAIGSKSGLSGTQNHSSVFSHFDSRLIFSFNLQYS